MTKTNSQLEFFILLYDQSHRTVLDNNSQSHSNTFAYFKFGWSDVKSAICVMFYNV